MSRTVRMLVCVVLAGCANPLPPPPPGGHVADDLMLLPDPLAAVAERIAAIGPLLSGNHPNSDADEALFKIARETAGLLGRPEFAAAPVLAGHLRTHVFFTAAGSMNTRRVAAAECRRLLDRIRERLNGPGKTGDTRKRTG